MKKLLVTLAILLSYNVSFCQIAFYAPKEAETATKALERPLFVKILSVDEKIMSKLTEDEKKAYVKETEDYNNVLKTSVAKYWTLHKNPTFVTSARLEEMDSEGVECTVLSFGPYQAGKALSEQSDASTIPYSYYINTNWKRAYLTTVQFTVMQRAETEADFRFILLNLAKYLSAEAAGKPYRDPSLYDKEQNLKILSEKTLLLTIDMIDTTRISRETALKTYAHPNKLKFVDIEEIYNAIESQDQNSLYLTYIYNDPKHVWMLAVVDPTTMNIIEMQSLARVYFSIGKQFTGIEGAKTQAAKFGGTAYDYQKPFTIWRSRTTTKMNDKDFKILGSKLCIGFNY